RDTRPTTSWPPRSRRRNGAAAPPWWRAATATPYSFAPPPPPPCLPCAPAQEDRRGAPAVVASGDRDTFQLASATTTIVHPVRAGEMARIGPEQVRERYGVEPSQVPDFIALRDDPSDKLPGARGIGPKTAASILAEHGTLDAALEAGRFSAQAEELRLY